ncbi:MerR family transcriptional regulator [Fusobacterium necrogenes]|nr:helix-turn-helix domain-containing protein [Fusobacterium necrogenes]
MGRYYDLVGEIMKIKYRISEVAKIFNISRQTLIFYHKKIF